MPKTATTDAEKKEGALLGTISQYMYIRKMDDEKLAKALGIQKDTLRRKMRDPGKFWVHEILAICRILQIPSGVNLFVGVAPQNEDLAYRVANYIMREEKR